MGVVLTPEVVGVDERRYNESQYDWLEVVGVD